MKIAAGCSTHLVSSIGLLLYPASGSSLSFKLAEAFTRGRTNGSHLVEGSRDRGSAGLLFEAALGN